MNIMCIIYDFNNSCFCGVNSVDGQMLQKGGILVDDQSQKENDGSSISQSSKSPSYPPSRGARPFL
jgi:hypothetical protein